MTRTCSCMHAADACMHEVEHHCRTQKQQPPLLSFTCCSNRPQHGAQYSQNCSNSPKTAHCLQLTQCMHDPLCSLQPKQSHCCQPACPTEHVFCLCHCLSGATLRAQRESCWPSQPQGRRRTRSTGGSQLHRLHRRVQEGGPHGRGGEGRRRHTGPSGQRLCQDYSQVRGGQGKHGGRAEG